LPPAELMQLKLRRHGVRYVWFTFLVCLLPLSMTFAQSFSERASQAAQALQNGDYTTAEQLYTELAHANPNLAEIQSNLGLAQYFQFKLGAAEESFRGALRLDPRLFVPNFFLGKMYFQKGRFTDALPSLKRAVETQPQDKSARSLLAADLVKLSRDNEAIAQYQQLLSEDPSDAECIYDLGLAYLDLGKRAYRHLREFKSTGFPDLVMAEFHAQQGLGEMAAVEYHQAISSSPQVPGLRVSLANLLLKSGKWQEAEAIFKQELAIDPYSYKSFFGLAASALQAGKEDSAVVYLDKAASIRPEFFDPLPECAMFGQVRMSSSTHSILSPATNQKSFGADLLSSCSVAAGGQPQAASLSRTNAVERRDEIIADYKSRFARLPVAQSERERRDRGLQSLREKRYEEGLSVLSPMTGKAGSDPESALAVARAFYDLRRFDEIPKVLSGTQFVGAEGLYLLGSSYGILALESMDKLTQIAPDSANLHRLLGDAYAGRERYGDAIHEYEAALKANPDDATLYLALGDAYFSDMQFKVAEETFARATKMDPLNAQAYYMLGYTLVQLHQPGEAIPVLQRALELNPHIQGGHAEMGKAYAESGQVQAAVQHLELASDTDTDGSLHFQLYTLYRRLGENEKAQRALVASDQLRRQMELRKFGQPMK
jgi:tetratricopeptide (TPR) repeat protein